MSDTMIQIITALPTRCTCCGACAANGDVHAEHCLINLPKCTDETIAEWERGKYDGEHGALPQNLADQAYVMGYTFARHRAKQILLHGA